MERFDFLVLGGGIAGLTFAHRVSKFGSVAVLTKRAPSEGNTAYAQGGIASVLAGDDSFENHISDTLNAGAGLCKREVVERCVREGPSRIRELIALGAEFTRIGLDGEGSGGLHLTREGGHTRRRVVHAADATGREVERALLATCESEKNISFFPDSMAIDLITERKIGRRSGDRCLGAHVLRNDGRPGEVFPDQRGAARRRRHPDHAPR
jgi:L-aspartate oxidase